MPAPSLKFRVLATLSLGAALTAAPAAAQHARRAHTATPAATRTIAESITALPRLSSLATALRTAELLPTLSGNGPFTVFAPDNSAFARVPAATQRALMAPARRTTLTNLLTYHVVQGRLTTAQLRQSIRNGQGKAVLTTVNGKPIAAMLRGDRIVLTDAKNHVVGVVAGDLAQSNGVVHIVDGLLTP